MPTPSQSPERRESVSGQQNQEDDALDVSNVSEDKTPDASPASRSGGNQVRSSPAAAAAAAAAARNNGPDSSIQEESENEEEPAAAGAQNGASPSGTSARSGSVRASESTSPDRNPGPSGARIRPSPAGNPGPIRHSDTEESADENVHSPDARERRLNEIRRDIARDQAAGEADGGDAPRRRLISADNVDRGVNNVDQPLPPPQAAPDVRMSDDVQFLKTMVEDMFVRAVRVRENVTKEAQRKMLDDVYRPHLPSGSRLYNVAYKRIKPVRHFSRGVARAHNRSLRDDTWRGKLYDFTLRILLITFYGILSVVETANNIVDALVPKEVKRMVDEADRRMGVLFRYVDAWLADWLNRIAPDWPVLDLTAEKIPQHCYDHLSYDTQILDDLVNRAFGPSAGRFVLAFLFPARFFVMQVAVNSWLVAKPLFRPVFKKVNIVI